MEKTEKKQWETPKIEDLSVQKTESGYTTALIVENDTYYPTSFPF